jgi:hypothetical protein
MNLVRARHIELFAYFTYLWYVVISALARIYESFPIKSQLLLGDIAFCP